MTQALELVGWQRTDPIGHQLSDVATHGLSRCAAQIRTYRSRSSRMGRSKRHDLVNHR
jgi:hypothetical protein